MATYGAKKVAFKRQNLTAEAQRALWACVGAAEPGTASPALARGGWPVHPSALSFFISALSAVKFFSF